MSRAHLSRSDYESYDDYDTEIRLSGERMCAPRKGTRGRSIVSMIVLLAAGSGGAWLSQSYPAEFQTVVSVASSLFVPRASPLAAPPPEPVAEIPPVAPPLPPDARSVADVPGAQTGEAVVAPPQSAPATPETSVAGTEPEPVAKPDPLPKPVADPQDPNQKRALAAGLHPDISRDLLSRLTAADYRNASKAIKTALVETPDRETYTWPREAGTKVAQFAVRFVTSAAPECRRYVVIITKDRWSTTAPAMETCGADLPTRKVVIKAAG